MVLALTVIGTLVAFVVMIGGVVILRRHSWRRAVSTQITRPLLRARKRFENPRVLRRTGQTPLRILRGRFHNRNFEASVKIFPADRKATLEIVLDIPQTFAMEIRRRSSKAAKKQRSIKLGDERMAKKYHVTAPDEFEALYFLSGEKIPNLLDQLFGAGIRLLKMHRGKLTATWNAKPLADAVDTERVVFAVTMLCWLTESMIQVQLTQSPERIAELLPDVKCPYCQSAIGDDPDGQGELELVACLKCGAAHHGECWEEHTRCAVFGCAAQPNEFKKLKVNITA